mmetsp:Transcript_17086/g.49045  ORF Transcript_17086/g.49045 Transcript_17086/m.49045 type:complete len:215 (-) Transcript_17086:881-1525(-)
MPLPPLFHRSRCEANGIAVAVPFGNSNGLDRTLDAIRIFFRVKTDQIIWIRHHQADWTAHGIDHCVIAVAVVTAVVTATAISSCNIGHLPPLQGSALPPPFSTSVRYGLQANLQSRCRPNLGGSPHGYSLHNAAKDGMRRYGLGHGLGDLCFHRMLSQPSCLFVCRSEGVHVTVLLGRLKGIAVGSVIIIIIVNVAFADSNRIHAQAKASLGSR